MPIARHDPAVPAAHTPGDILNLVRLGVATSRSDLARITGLAASTVSLRVEGLLAHGYLEESSARASGRGRRPRVLRVRADSAMVGVADLGSHHAVVGVMDPRGRLVETATRTLRIDDGPSVVVPWVHDAIRELAAAGPGTDQRLQGIALGLPGPIEAGAGRVVSPSRMPGWNGVDVKTMLEDQAGVPVLVENDANLMAVGEYTLLDADVRHMIFLKAGSGMGCGVVASGELHRGARGAAGDISHVRVAGAPDITCSCGRIGCLEVVASGAALVRSLREQGFDITETAQVLHLVDSSDPAAARLLRAAGRATGEVLAAVVNFFNPQVLVIGGLLSHAEPFVAAIRSTLYDLCLPMATERLDISGTKAGVHAGVLGAGTLLLEHLFSRHVVNTALGVR